MFRQIKIKGAKLPLNGRRVFTYEREIKKMFQDLQLGFIPLKCSQQQSLVHIGVKVALKNTAYFTKFIYARCQICTSLSIAI